LALGHQAAEIAVALTPGSSPRPAKFSRLSRGGDGPRVVLTQHQSGKGAAEIAQMAAIAMRLGATKEGEVAPTEAAG